MFVTFTTKSGHTAYEYLRTSFKTIELTKEMAKPIIDLVEAGKISIGDPFMYGGCPVYGLDQCSEDDKKIVTDWREEMNKEVVRKYEETAHLYCYVGFSKDGQLVPERWLKTDVPSEVEKFDSYIDCSNYCFKLNYPQYYTE